MKKHYSVWMLTSAVILLSAGGAQAEFDTSDATITFGEVAGSSALLPYAEIHKMAPATPELLKNTEKSLKSAHDKVQTLSQSVDEMRKKVSLSEEVYLIEYDRLKKADEVEMEANRAIRKDYRRNYEARRAFDAYKREGAQSILSLKFELERSEKALNEAEIAFEKIEKQLENHRKGIIDGEHVKGPIHRNIFRAISVAALIDATRRLNEALNPKEVGPIAYAISSKAQKTLFESSPGAFETECKMTSSGSCEYDLKGSGNYQVNKAR